VVVHVHPDGTTDTTVYDGKVEAQNDVTNQVTHMLPGDGAKIGHEGTTGYSEDDQVTLDTATGDTRGDIPEHRRGDSPVAQQRNTPEPAATGGDEGGEGDDGGEGCDCI
jgi:hypothetical protein